MLSWIIIIAVLNYANRENARKETNLTDTENYYRGLSETFSSYFQYFDQLKK